MIYDITLNKKLCNSCTTYIVLLAIVFLIIIDISGAYFYFYWYLRKDNTYVNTSVNIGIKTETII